MPDINIILTPAEFEYYNITSTDNIIVVIDIFRATSTIVTALANGAASVIPVSHVNDALKYKNNNYLVAAEKNGIPIPGFDFGNSPLEFLNSAIKGKHIVITTTNGTQAIQVAKNKGEIIIGSFLNLNAVAEYIISQNKNVIMLCAGWKNKFNLEDFVFAGSLTHYLYSTQTYTLASDSALLGYLTFDRSRRKLKEFLNMASHKKRLENLNLDADIDFCLTLNKYPIVPKLVNEKIICQTQQIIC
ncbi:MAG: 2-phosphosulfolactate phosphatase [Bacteroidetes bacterium]|nr:MAG: 2-phosphosulfolactate phosphatase [Bacteroidota bacterium]